MDFDLGRDIDWPMVWEWVFNIGTVLLISLITHFIAKGAEGPSQGRSTKCPRCKSTARPLPAKLSAVRSIRWPIGSSGW